MNRVLVLDRVHDDGMSLLRERGDITLTHLPSPTPHTILRAMAEAEILLLRSRTIEPEVYESLAPHLRFISRHGVGCDNLPLPVLAEKGVKVAITAAANVTSVAEHAMMLMLAVARNLVAADAAVRNGNFALREDGRAVELAGRTLLIVGMGRIGRQVAARAHAFGIRVIGYDPLLSASAGTAGIERMEDLDAALGQADIVSLHIPSTNRTRGSFDAARFERFRKGAFLINTARGGIVDEAAMRAALETGRLAGAGVDVFETEPLPGDDPVLGAPNLIVTPHNAAMTAEGARRMAIDSAQAILDYIDGRHDRLTLAG